MKGIVLNTVAIFVFISPIDKDNIHNNPIIGTF
jgi:hypothetical protein